MRLTDVVASTLGISATDSLFGRRLIRRVLWAGVLFLALQIAPLKGGHMGNGRDRSLLASAFAADELGLESSGAIEEQSLAGGGEPSAKNHKKLRGSACDFKPPNPFPPLNKCITKETENTTKDVLIGKGASSTCGGHVSLEINGFSKNEVGTITINPGGTLELYDKQVNDADKKSVAVTIAGIHITDGGSLLIGDSACPIGTIKPEDNVKITFTGERPKPTDCGDLSKPSSSCAGYVKGIQVDKGGTLKMYGLKGVPPNGINWTYLSQPAGDPKKFSSGEGVLAVPPKASNIIYTAASVDSGTGAWRDNDWIAVATTSFSPWETEFLQIEKIEKNTDKDCGPKKDQNCGESRITLKPGLAYYHFGGLNPGDPSTDANYKADAKTNYGVDERAEVGLISRNILLTSDSDTLKTNLHWGGELKFLEGFSAVALQGVELQKFGKEQLGSYPIHFHIDRDVGGRLQLVDSNSIDHSYNKCITTHSTQNATYSNNVCARITGHIFYQEIGDESNTTFNGNLGIGAMSNSFDVNAIGNGSDCKANGTPEACRDSLIDQYYWVGDHMFARPIPQDNGKNQVFDQFRIFDTDNQSNPIATEYPKGNSVNITTVRGKCGQFLNDNTGRISLNVAPPYPPEDPPAITCYPGNTKNPDKIAYFEPPTGFWILNPSAKLMNNSIGGCQDTGSAYWYVMPNNTGIKNIPIGEGSTYPTDPSLRGVFKNNRGHSCYRGLVDELFELGTGDSLAGFQDATIDSTHHPLVDEFDSLTLSRIRYRAVWLRPAFYYLKDARFATDQRAISFVTSGGADGNYPGVWSLLGHSTLVGISQNNVDRFGPCGSKVLTADGFHRRGAQYGCIDVTVPKAVPTGGGYMEQGYATPDRNMFGFMSYDGPPLIVTDRFVNFLADPVKGNLLTQTDQKVLTTWNFVNPHKEYEGDAAIGWLEANQSAYPTAASSKDLSFTDVDLRHQVYTDKVNIDTFNDGDKNTAIIDLDGSLSGYQVGNSKGNQIDGAFPISLNNLEFNASSNSVDECKATGQQNISLEGRPTAAMVPSYIGQLEFESLYPNNSPGQGSKGWNRDDHSQLLTFYKDTLDFGQHGSMSLHDRNGNGIWEPKVASSYGYVVRADTYKNPTGSISGVGIPKIIDVGLVDTVMPNISIDNPFYIQLGICYSDDIGKHPANNFTISRGYKSWGGGVGLQRDDLTLRKYFNKLDGLTDANQFCNNLDSQGFNTDITKINCPADGITLGKCPSIQGLVDITDTTNNAACKFPKDTAPLATPLTKVKDEDGIKGMTSDGTPNGPPNLDKYFYDQGTGMLYLWIAQVRPNAAGPSPLGSCTGSSDPAFCPQAQNGVSTGESYYNCPAEGCPTYRITMNDPDYKTFGTSTCKVFGGNIGDANDWATGTGGATWPAPPPPDRSPMLVYQKTTFPKTTVARAMPSPSPLPHYADADPNSLNCPINQPPK